MKKTLLIIILLITFKGLAQQDSIQKTPTSEIKVNAFNLILANAIDISYEYLLNKNQSLGLAVFVKLKHEQPLHFRISFAPYDPELISYKTFSLIPYYRYYFSKKYARGFFIEGFTMYENGKDFENSYNDDGSEEIISSNYSVLKTGLGFGIKIVTRKNLVVDINQGFGIDLSRIQYVSNDFFVRVAISAGYRF